jgi:hypothetical protein
MAHLPSAQLFREERSELDRPAPHCLVGDLDPALGQQLLDISVAQKEAVVEPDRLGDHVGWVAMPMVAAGAVKHGAFGGMSRT